MMKGIWFGDIHSYANLNLILSKVDLPPATVKETYVDNPGGDGSWDLTEANGKVNYKDRKAKFTFSVLPGDDFEAKKTEISNLLNGRRFKIVLDKDPEYYWDGRCSVNKYESKKKDRKIVVAANVSPYKLKKGQTRVFVPFSGRNLFNNAELPKIGGSSANIESIATGVRATWVQGKSAYVLVKWLPLDMLIGETITLSCDIVESGGAKGTIQIGYAAASGSPRQSEVKLESTGAVSFTVEKTNPQYEYLAIWFYANNGTDPANVSEGAYVDYLNVQIELGEVSEDDLFSKNLFKAEFGGDGYFASGFYDELEIVDANTISGIPTVGQGRDYIRFAQKYPPGVFTLSNKCKAPRQMLWLFDADGNNISAQYQTKIQNMNYNQYYDGFFMTLALVNVTIPSGVAFWRYGVFFEPDNGNKVTLSEIQVSSGSDIPYEPYWRGYEHYVPFRGKNLLDPESITSVSNTTINNGIVTQKNADTKATIYVKCYGYLSGTYIKSFGLESISKQGIISFVFQKTDDFDRIYFGLNGSITDTTVAVNVADLPNGTYTMQANFTNITQGSVSWKDMQIELGDQIKPLGNNLIPYPYARTTKTIAGVTFTVNDNRSITLSGTATGVAAFYLYDNKNKPFPVGYYSVIANNVCEIRCYHEDQSTTTFSSSGGTINVTKPIVQIALLIRSGTTYNNTIYPMFNKGTTALPYEPFIGYEPYNPPAEVTLTNGRKQVVPTLICTTETKFDVDGLEFTVNEGKHKVLDFQLTEGETHATLRGEGGAAAIVYQEGDL